MSQQAVTFFYIIATFFFTLVHVSLSQNFFLHYCASSHITHFCFFRHSKIFISMSYLFYFLTQHYHTLQYFLKGSKFLFRSQKGMLIPNLLNNYFISKILIIWSLRQIWFFRSRIGHILVDKILSVCQKPFKGVHWLNTKQKLDFFNRIRSCICLLRCKENGPLGFSKEK